MGYIKNILGEMGFLGPKKPMSVGFGSLGPLLKNESIPLRRSVKLTLWPTQAQFIERAKRVTKRDALSNNM